MTVASQTVLITGAAGHLGKAVASVFAARGARLLLLDRQVNTLLETHANDANVAVAAADLLRCEQIESALRDGVQRFGRIDALCHLAGGFRMGDSVHETTTDTWEFLFDINARTFVNVARAAVPHFLERGGGKIVSVGAAAALKGGAQMGAYSASKSALIRLAEAMSAELKDKNINVNCVLPTIIDTPENRASMPDADPTRWVAPAALAEVIAFLCSDDARAIHGASIPVTGLV